MHPKLLLLCVLLGAAGVVLARGRLRWGVVLLLGTSLAMMVIAPATVIWSSRYAVPPRGRWSLPGRSARGSSSVGFVTVAAG